MELAKKAAEGIRQSGEKWAYRDIAETAVRAGDAADVEAWAASLHDPLLRACVCQGAALGLLPPAAGD